MGAEDIYFEMKWDEVILKWNDVKWKGMKWNEEEWNGLNGKIFPFQIKNTPPFILYIMWWNEMIWNEKNKNVSNNTLRAVRIHQKIRGAILYYCVKRREKKRKLEKKISPPSPKKSHLSGKKGSYPPKIMVAGEKKYI